MNGEFDMSSAAGSQLEALAEHGYTVIPGGVERRRESHRHILARMRLLHTERGRAPQADQPFLNRGHDILYNLQRESVLFTRVFTRNPLVMDILRGLLNDAYYRQIPADRPNFLMRSLIGRSSGAATLPLHLDSFIPSSGRYCMACQVAVVLEDQTPETGCTLVVPGSHRADAYADQEAMARAIPLVTRSGDLVIWDGRLWHGALGNQTPRSRWSLIATFARWWIKQNFDMTGTLPQALYEAFDDDEKAVLGYCSRPPRDEMERVDIKSGHAALKTRVADYGRRAPDDAPETELIDGDRRRHAAVLQVPYAGYFRLFAAADVFVAFDCVQFPRRGWVHRNRFAASHGGLDWLTLPLRKCGRDTRIDELRFADDAPTAAGVAGYAALSGARGGAQRRISVARPRRRLRLGHGRGLSLRTIDAARRPPGTVATAGAFQLSRSAAGVARPGAGVGHRPRARRHALREFARRPRSVRSPSIRRSGCRAAILDAVRRPPGQLSCHRS